jgi:hypothetical protein
MPWVKAAVEVEFDGEKMPATNHCTGNGRVFGCSLDPQKEMPLSVAGKSALGRISVRLAVSSSVDR